MADPLSTVVGIGITSFLLFYFSSQFGSDQNDPARQILQLLAVSFGVLLLILIPKALYDAQTVCEPVLSNTSVLSNVTHYTYTNYCYDAPTSTPNGIYRGLLWFFRVFIIILLLRLGYTVVTLMMKFGGGRSR